MTTIDQSQQLIMITVPVRGEVGDWIEQLRVEEPVLDWQTSLPPHVTILPPSRIRGSLDEARQMFEDYEFVVPKTRMFFKGANTFLNPKNNVIWLSPAESLWFIELHEDGLDLYSHIAEPHKDFNLVPHVTIFEKVGDFELELRRSKYHKKRFDHPTSLDEVALLIFDQSDRRWRQIAQSRLR